MIKKEWWLAAGAISAAMGGQQALAQNAPEKAGVAAAVNPSATGQIGNNPSQVMVVASDVYRDEHIVTGAGGQVHLLFTDESALTVGPDSEVVLDKFVYNPDANTGELALSLSRGAMRFIGGKLSKVNPINVRVGTATIGVRGCTLFLNRPTQAPAFQAIFAAGVEAIFSNNGVQTDVTHPGTGIEFNGTVFGSTFLATPATFQTFTRLLNGPAKGAPGVWNRTANRISTLNSDRRAQKVAPGAILTDLNTVTQSNANFPRTIGVGPNNTQEQTKEHFDQSSPSNNSP